MIQNLSIKHYKSIKELSLSPKRVNLFIGAHNTGKSNILEALTWLSVNGLQDNVFTQLFKVDNAGGYFHDFDKRNTIEVVTDLLSLKLRFVKNDYGVPLKKLEGILYKNNKLIEGLDDWNVVGDGISAFELNMNNNSINYHWDDVLSPVKVYLYKKVRRWGEEWLPYLNPPFGENMLHMLQTNEACRQIIGDILRSIGYQLPVHPVSNDILVAKETNEGFTIQSFFTLSDSIQRYIFMLLAVTSNSNSILVFDEQWNNLYPPLVKDIGERIATDTSNQYFLATHNPYLLDAILTKTPRQELAVYITFLQDGTTQVAPCNEIIKENLIRMGSDSFFHLEELRWES